MRNTFLPKACAQSSGARIEKKIYLPCRSAFGCAPACGSMALVRQAIHCAASYDAASNLTGFVSGNSGSFAGITNSFSFNKRLQPVNMSASAPSQTVFSLGYDFHSANGDNGNPSASPQDRLIAITNYKDNSRNQSFTYDSLNRLTSAQNAGTNCAAGTVNGKSEYWGNAYGYDAWGNLTDKTKTKCNAEDIHFTVDAHNWLHVLAGADYAYDAAGNMTYNANGAQSYSYDQENRVTGAAGYAYTYDGDGNRVEKSNGSTGMLYWYMSPGIVAESDLGGNLTSEYVFFDGERVARKDFPGLAVSYYFSDHLKTTDIVTDASGNIKNESDFYPWGGELEFLANDSNHYKFTGKERDSETGLDYFGARYYSNGLGRFVSTDPIHFQSSMLRDPQRFNLYGYVRNNPLRYIDPKGEAIELVGNDEERKKTLAAAKSAVGKDAGNYLYENKVETTDKNGNKTTRYFIGVYTNGPDGKGPAFETINKAAASLSQAIGTQTVLRAEVLPQGTRVIGHNGDSERIGSIKVGMSPGYSFYGKDGYVHMAILDPSTDPGTLPGSMMSNGLPGDVDQGELFGHELGHNMASIGAWIPSTDHDGVDLENQVRQSRDPNGPTRTREDPPQ